jgi:predicted GNAT family acetyltransferase
MQIGHEENSNKGAFFVRNDGKRTAELLYIRSAPGRINIYHTEVDQELRGTGTGEKLIAAAVEYARKEGLRITATCPYAKKVLEGRPDFQDMLADDQ